MQMAYFPCYPLSDSACTPSYLSAPHLSYWPSIASNAIFDTGFSSCSQSSADGANRSNSGKSYLNGFWSNPWKFPPRFLPRLSKQAHVSFLLLSSLLAVARLVKWLFALHRNVSYVLLFQLSQYNFTENFPTLPHSSWYHCNLRPSCKTVANLQWLLSLTTAPLIFGSHWKALHWIILLRIVSWKSCR